MAFLILCLAFTLAAAIADGSTDQVMDTSPNVTPFPKLDLVKRQTTAAGWSSTCGYITGDTRNPITCPNGYCGFNSGYNAVGCCATYASTSGSYYGVDCQYRTSCFWGTATTLCTGACAANTLNLLCTQAAAPYCAKYTYTDIGYAILACSAASTTITAQYYLATTNPTVTYQPIPGTASSSRPTSTTTVTPTSTPTTSAPSTTSSPTASSVIVITASINSVGANVTPSPTPSEVPSGPNVGAIAGGVVGGVVGLAAIIGLVVLILRRRKRSELSRNSMQEASPTTQYEVQAMYGGSGMPPGPPPGQYGAYAANQMSQGPQKSPYEVQAVHNVH